MTSVTREERFWKFVDKSGDCWIWTGGRNGPGGYGFFADRGHMYAHRFSYQMAHGTIPEGLFVLHRCDNKPCVNPAHLFLGTQKVNMDDMAAKGRAAWARPRQGKVVCKRGHAYTPENTYRRPDGTRTCRACLRLRGRVYDTTRRKRGSP